MPHPIPYLSFNGDCAQAVRFYERALGGKIEMLMRTADSPMAAQTPRNSPTGSCMPASRFRVAACSMPVTARRRCRIPDCTASASR